MKIEESIRLSGNGILLLPLEFHHEDCLGKAAADGELWNLRITGVPTPDETAAYITTALDSRARGDRFAFAVIDERSETVIGSTSYHDILPDVKRLEIGYTWYAQRFQRTYVNTACKILMLTHAFEALGANVVGWRTDNFNFKSQKAIERLGAKKDGVIRGNAMRRDGTIRDTVMYSLHKGEWPEVRQHLEYLLSLPKA